MIFNEESRLADAIFLDSSLIGVFDRMGIRLGVGDLTFAQAALAIGVSTDFLVAIVNTFVNPDYLPRPSADIRERQRVEKYLAATRHSCECVYLPNIERHLNSLLSRSGTNNNLAALRGFFMQLKSGFIACISREDEFYARPSDCNNTSTESKNCNESSAYDLFGGICEAWDNIEDQVADLAAFFVIHLKGDYDSNLCMAVVNAIFMLKKELRQNNRLRRRILFPLMSR